jgi:homoserine dehydrogenase
MSIGIGIIGAGTVGQGVLEILASRGEFFKSELGIDFKVVRVASRTPKASIHPTALCPWDNQPEALIQDPNVHVVVEVAGGYDAPKAWVQAALEAGKPVVTANKALLAKYGTELFPIAAQKGLPLLFEAAVGGGIPIIRAIQESLQANHILGLSAIINGTCNYILTEMSTKGSDFDAVLAEAQKLGYAEADPTFDIDGIDASHKLAILASLASYSWVNFESFPVEGIRHVDAADIAFAAETGHQIKLLGRLQVEKDGIDVRVQPFLVPDGHLLSHVQGVLNAVHLETDQLGPALLTGAGAGKGPTASAIVADLVRVGQTLKDSEDYAPALGWWKSDRPAKLLNPGSWQGRFYIRLRVQDTAGVLAQVATILGQNAVSLASLVQRPVEGQDAADLFLATHTCPQDAVDRALQELNALPILLRPGLRYPFLEA